MNDSNKIVFDLLTIVTKYWKVKRSTIVKDRYSSKFKIDDESIRENLVEHVGLLPIIATYIYPHISRKNEVNIERCLAMLSIHDIGETVTGDIPTSLKTEQNANNERDIVKNILDKNQWEWFLEFEDHKTVTSLYAKGIDCVAAFVNDILLPTKIASERLKKWNYDVDKITKYAEKWFI